MVRAAVARDSCVDVVFISSGSTTQMRRLCDPSMDRL
jgi:hypothetical protein